MSKFIKFKFKFRSSILVHCVLSGSLTHHLQVLLILLLKLATSVFCLIPLKQLQLFSSHSRHVR